MNPPCRMCGGTGSDEHCGCYNWGDKNPVCCYCEAEMHEQCTFCEGTGVQLDDKQDSLGSGVSGRRGNAIRKVPQRKRN